MSISNPEFSSSTLLNPVEVHGTGGEHKKGLGVMMLAAIGVVFGDIGTSPLYALKECFDSKHGIAYTPEALFGVISMMIWALILVVTVKYVLFVMRADNKGEGGVLSLMALALRSFDSK
jgi:KUP system potassium uptake protein